MKRKNIIIIILLICLIIESMLLLFGNKDTNSVKNTSDKIIEKEKALSMMLETSYESGEYKESTLSKWPTPSDGYLFNASISNCQNGGEVTWDEENNTVLLTSNTSDKCYVYFDAIKKAVINEITATEIISNSVTISINATKGTYDISKYYYSIDNGSSWNVSTSNVITISNLSKETAYTIRVYVQDSKGINSEYENINITTTSSFSFTICGYPYEAEEGMTWREWGESSYTKSPFCSSRCFVGDQYLISCGCNVSINISDVIEENREYGGHYNY